MKTLEQLLVEKPVTSIGLFFYPEQEFFCIIDGEKYSATNITREFFDQVHALVKEKRLDEVRDLFISQGGNEDLIRLAAVRLLVSVGDVRVRGNSFYMDPLPHKLPASLVEEMIEITRRHWVKEKIADDDDYLILRNFWIWVKNIWEQRTDKKSVFEDKFIQSLLQDYKQGQHFFKDVLKDKKTDIKISPVQEMPKTDDKPNVDLSGRLRQL